MFRLQFVKRTHDQNFLFLHLCVCVCVYVCVFPHPWTSSSAWSAWSECQPQPPCLPLSSWKQVRLDAEVCVCLASRVRTARMHVHMPSFFLLSSSSPPQWLLLAETLSPSSLRLCFLTPSHHVLPLCLSHTLFFPPVSLPPSLLFVFLPSLCISITLPPSLGAQSLSRAS